MADNGNTESLSRELGQRGALVSRLNWIEAEKDSLSHEWELLSRYLDLLDRYLTDTLRDWEQDIEQQAQQIDNEGQRIEFYDFHSDEYHEHLSFRGTLMNSFFLASFALFENQLMRICWRAQRDCGNSISAKDLRSRSPTDRAKKYLRKLGVEFPAETSEWQEITKHREIRNKIAHEGGVLPLQGHIADFAKSKQIVTAGVGNLNLELNRPFCDDALCRFRRFLLEVHRAYVLWLKANK